MYKSHYENVPFEIPESWVLSDFSELVTLLSGRDLESNDCNSNREGIPYLIGASNIVDGKINITRWTTKPLVISKRGDILISCKGTIGEVVTNVIGEIHIARQFMAIQTSPMVYADYIELYIKSIVNNIKRNARGVIPGISREDILHREIALPPLEEQKRIVIEVEKWLDFIADIEAEKDELESHIKQTKSKILDLAISGKLVPQDPNDEPAIELLKRINPSFEPCDNSHYENLPQGWAVCRLSDMVRIQNGFAFQSAKYIDVGIRIIRITNVQSGYIIDESPKFYPHNLMEGLDEYNLKNGDLLMSLTGNVGRVGIMPENLLPAALNQRVCCIKPKNNDIDKMYLFYYFQAEQFIQDCIASGKGVAQLNVSTEWLKHYIIQLPPKEEQSRIVKTIDALFSIIDKITAEL